MGSEEKDLTQKFDDWIKKSPDIMALKWLRSQIDELREKLKEKIWIIQDDRMTDFGIKLGELSQKSEDIEKLNIFMKVQGIAINSHENEIRKIKELHIHQSENDQIIHTEIYQIIEKVKEELSEIYNGSSLLQKELDIRVDILKTKMKVFRIDKIEKILFDIGKELLLDDAPRWNEIWEKIEKINSKPEPKWKKQDDYRFKKKYTQEVLDSKIKEAINKPRENDIDLDDAQAIGYEKGINKGKKLQKQFDISQVIKKLGYLVKDCDGHSKEYYHNKLIELKEKYQEKTITKKGTCQGCIHNEDFTGICLNKEGVCVAHDKYEPIKTENETRIIDCMTNDEFEIQLNNIRNTRLGTAMSSLKGCILRERRLSKKETISKVVEKIESMRVKFADATKNYTTMDLMNELWEYKRELEKKVK